MKSLQKGLAARQSFAAIVLIGVVSGNLHAAKTFRWKLVSGDRFEATMAQSTTQTMTVGEQTVEIPHALTLTMSWRITSVDDGLITMTQTIDRAQMTMTVDGGDVQFDSDDSAVPSGSAKRLADALQPMVGATFTQVMTDRGRVKDVIVPDSVVKAFDDDPVGKEFFGGPAFKDMMAKASPVLPKMAINKGYSWKNNSATKTPAGTMNMRSKFTYQGEGDLDGRAVDRFGTTVNLDFDDKENDLGAKIEISKQKNAGTIFFDSAAGHIARVTMDQALTMKVTVGDQVVDQDVKSSLTLTVKRSGD